MDEVRIAYVIATLDRAGTETQLVRLATHLRRPPFTPRVFVLTRGGALEDDLLSAGVPFEVLGKRRKLDFKTLWRLYHSLRGFTPHIVHTWLFTANSFGRLAARLARVPVIVASERSLDPWKSPLHNLVDDFLGSFTSRIVANAQAVKQEVLRRHPRFEGKLELIYNGIPAVAPARGRLEVRSSLGIPLEAQVLVSVGRLSCEKGFEDLLQAFKVASSSIGELYLLIVGQGKEEARLKELSRELGIARQVRFLGELPGVAEVLAASDIFVLTSRYEGLPNSMLEAMRLGLPVLAVAVGGIPEVVEDGRTGMLVSPGNRKGLADAIVWLAIHPHQRSRLACAGKTLVQTRFCLARMVHGYENLYLKLIGNQR